MEEERNKDIRYTENNRKITDVNLALPVIVLNINELNILICKSKGSNWQSSLKNDDTICQLQETHFKLKKRKMLKAKDEKKRYAMQTMTRRDLNWHD